MMAVQELIDPHPITSIIESPWYVMLTQPQQDLTTVWRLHELGLEMFVPVIRKRVKTGRVGKNGHKLTRVIAKPMFPGYGFLRATETNSPESLVWRERHGSGVRGIRNFMRDEENKPIQLPHLAVLAVFRRQMEEQRMWIEEQAPRRMWNPGDKVRIDEDGGAWAGLVGTIEWANRKGNIGVLLGMIKHTLRADMVVAI